MMYLWTPETGSVMEELIRHLDEQADRFERLIEEEKIVRIKGCTPDPEQVVDVSAVILAHRCAAATLREQYG